MTAPIARLNNFGNLSIAGSFDEVTYDLSSGYQKNLISYSHQFNISGYWGASGVLQPAPLGVAPDGSGTAVLMTENTDQNTNHWFQKNISPEIPYATYTLSCYFKPVSGDRNFFLQILDAATGGGGGYSSLMSNTNGTLNSYYGTTGDFSNGSGTIVPVGNGWFRAIITQTLGKVANNTIRIALFNNGAQYYTGNGVSCMWIWGAQLEAGAQATDYEPTDANAFVSVPRGFTTRLDPTGFYTIGSLDEVSINNTTAKGTNLLAGSQSNFSNNTYWLQSTAYNIYDNSVLAPDGTLTGSTVWIQATANALPQYVNVIPATTYTFSFYAIRGTATNLTYSVFDNINATNISAGVSYYSQLNSQTWTRVYLTFTTPANCTSIRVYPIRDNGVLGNFYLWGAQLEVGATATDYVPTGAGSVPVVPFVERKASGGLHRIIGQYDEVSHAVNTTGLVYHIDPGNPASYNPLGNPNIIYNIAPQGMGSKTGVLTCAIDGTGPPTFYNTLGYGSLSFTRTGAQSILTNSSHYMTIGTGAWSSGNTQYTISAWFYCTAPAYNSFSTAPYNGETIISGGNPLYYYAGGSPGGCDIYIARNTYQGLDQIFVGFWTSPGKDYIVGSPYQLNRWNMVTSQVVTSGGTSTIRLYLNGALAGTPLTGVIAGQSSTGGYQSTGEYFTIGHNINGVHTSTQGGGSGFNGNIGAITMYNRALSSLEIADLFNIQRSLYNV